MDHLFNIESPFFHLLTRIVDIVLLNLLFILFCLPIFTIGASVTALYSVLMKMMKKEEKQIVKGFFGAFKRNFFQSTVIWMVMIVSGFVILVNYFMLGSLSGLVKFFFTGMIFIFGFLYGSILMFIFPYIARYADSIKQSLKNALLMGIQNIPYLIVLLLLNGFFILFVFSSKVGLLTGVYIGTFGGCAFLAYMNAHLFMKIFSKYEASH